MIKSMTAYGRGEATTEGRLYVAEIRAVNGRYRDIVIRLPRDLQVLEKELRDQVSRQVSRGRIEVSVQVEAAAGEPAFRVELNTPLVESTLTALHQLADLYGLAADIRAETLCQMKDVLVVKPLEADLEETRAGLSGALDQALESLTTMRRAEGAAIEADFRHRLDLLERHLARIEQRLPELLPAYRQALLESVRRFAEDVKIDEDRLAQEVVLHAERADVTEELVRFRSHLQQFRDYLGADEAVGKRLDFLLQEIHREINTLGVKSSDTTVSNAVVEMKAELEKLREQVQNVE